MHVIIMCVGGHPAELLPGQGRTLPCLLPHQDYANVLMATTLGGQAAVTPEAVNSVSGELKVPGGLGLCTAVMSISTHYNSLRHRDR